MSVWGKEEVGKKSEEKWTKVKGRRVCVYGCMGEEVQKEKERKKRGIEESFVFVWAQKEFKINVENYRKEEENVSLCEGEGRNSEV